jgi:hypothetical protein
MATAVFASVQKTRPDVLYPHAQWYFLLALVTTWIGFSRSYFAVLRSEPLLHHIHGALMGGWICLLILQPILYQRNRIELHRRLGRWGVYLLVPAIVVCGFLMVRGMFRTTQLPPFIVNHLAFLDLGSLLLMPTFVGLAVYYGRNVQLHARYIACTVLLLMPPALVRASFLLPFAGGGFATHVNVAMGLMSLILALLIVDDARRGHVRAPYPVALVANTVIGVAANFAQTWGWWHGLTAWIRG